MPAKILRLALLGKEINQAINFDPEGDTIPVLYDQYDKLAENYWAGTRDDYSRLFELIHPNRRCRRSRYCRASQVAFIAQMPHMDIYKEFSDADQRSLPSARRMPRDGSPNTRPKNLSSSCRRPSPKPSLASGAEQKSAYSSRSIHRGTCRDAEWRRAPGKNLRIKKFKAVYLLFLGKDHGPKAGWFFPFCRGSLS